MTASKEPKKKKTTGEQPSIETFFRNAKREERAVIIRPHQFLKGAAGHHCKITERHIEAAREMAEAGCTNRDIRDKLGFRQTIFVLYMNQGRIIEEYLRALGCVPEEDEWENLLSACVDLEDEAGEKARIYDTHLKYKFYRAIVDARVSANMADLKTIRNAGNKDWKAAAYVLEKRCPDYRKDADNDDKGLKIQVQNNTLIQNILSTAKQLEQQDRVSGLIPENAGAENEDDIINAEYEKYVKEQLERSDENEA